MEQHEHRYILSQVIGPVVDVRVQKRENFLCHSQTRLKDNKSG